MSLALRSVRRASIMNRPISPRLVIVCAAYLLLVATGFAWVNSKGTIAIACTALIILMSIFSSSEICCRLLFICMPFFNIMGVDLGGTSLYYIIVLLFIVKAIADGTCENAGRRVMLFFVVIVATLYNFSSGLLYIKWLIHLTVPFALLGTQRFRRYLPEYIRYWTLSLVLSSFIGLIMLNSGTYLYMFGSVRTGMEVVTRFSGLVGDAVVYGQLVSVALAANAFLSFSGKGYRLLVPACIALVYFSLLTYSKGALVCLALVGLSAVVLFTREALKNRLPLRHISIFILTIAVASAASKYLAEGGTAFSLDALLTRLDSSDLLTSRGDIWSAYIRYWGTVGPAMALRGIGFDTYISTTVFGRWHNCHSVYIEAVTLFGFLGAIVIAALLFGYFQSKRRQGARAVSYLPAAIMLASGVILHGFIDMPFFYVWTVALGCIGYSAPQYERGAGCQV